VIKVHHLTGHYRHDLVKGFTDPGVGSAHLPVAESSLICRLLESH
jgi:hypothetical protein